MAQLVLLHLAGEEAVAGEVEELPKPTDNIITITNPRKKDGKELHFLDNRAVKVIYPLAKISFIEILSAGEEEQIVGFVRE
ncbi:MAG: hypothetical protein AB1750_03015 [Chloroflexota bacterium]